MIYRLLLTTAFLALVLRVACTPAPPPEPPAPAPDTGDCGAVCDRWRQLGCEEAKPTPHGASCEVVCDSLARYWHLSCLAAVSSCEEIEACP